MKKFFVFMLVLIFTANSYVVAAWASSCPHEIASMAEMADDEMPCHEEEQPQNNTHCEGLCLCAHVATAPITIINDHISFTNSPYFFEQISSYQNILVSFISTPQGPPPKSFS